MMNRENNIISDQANKVIFQEIRNALGRNQSIDSAFIDSLEDDLETKTKAHQLSKSKTLKFKTGKIFVSKKEPQQMTV